LPSVNELNFKPVKAENNSFAFNSIHNNSENTLTSTLKNLLILLFKKILVYSSKLSALQIKLKEINPLFDGTEIIKNVDLENKEFLTLHDMAYFMHLYGYQMSDWDSFRMMCFLSKYRLTTLQELIEQEKISEAKEFIVKASELKNVDHEKKNIQNETVVDLNKRNDSYSIRYHDFLNLFIPLKNYKHFENLEKNKKMSIEDRKRKIYQIVRQIILLSFRKLDEIGAVVRKLRKIETKKIFEYLTQFNNQEFVKKSFKFMGSFGHGNHLLNIQKSTHYKYMNKVNLKKIWRTKQV
jgi:hypothetical protein